MPVHAIGPFDVKLTPQEDKLDPTLGRMTFHQNAVIGNTTVPLSDGLNIVRAGDTVQKIVR